MTHLPPSTVRPPSRGFAAGRWLATSLAIALTLASCASETRPPESLAGLAIGSSGAMGVTDSEGRLAPVAGPQGDVRRVSAANGRLAVLMADDQLFLADAPEAGGSWRWRPLTVELPSARTPAGMDLSLDGGTLAIALGDPDTRGLDLLTVDVETGETAIRSIDLALNGPPTWFGPNLVVLEVIRPDDHAGIVVIDPATGDVTVTKAEGIEPSVIRDGNRIAVVGPSGVVITDAAGWLEGAAAEAVALSSPDDSTILDIAIDADGTGLAVVYAANSGHRRASSRFALSSRSGRAHRRLRCPATRRPSRSTGWTERHRDQLHRGMAHFRSACPSLAFATAPPSSSWRWPPRRSP